MNKSTFDSTIPEDIASNTMNIDHGYFLSFLPQQKSEYSGDRIPTIQKLDPFKNRTFQSSDFEWSWPFENQISKWPLLPRSFYIQKEKIVYTKRPSLEWPFWKFSFRTVWTINLSPHCVTDQPYIPRSYNLRGCSLMTSRKFCTFSNLLPPLSHSYALSHEWMNEWIMCLFSS